MHIPAIRFSWKIHQYTCTVYTRHTFLSVSFQIYLTRNTPIGVVVREPSAVKHCFRGVCPPKLEFWGHLGGQKLYHRIARPRCATLRWNHLNILNRLAAVSVSLFSWGSVPQNWGLGGTLECKVIPSDSPPLVC